MVSESTIEQPRRPLHLVIAGGGTGGHISPAIAVTEYLQSRCDLNVTWIGSNASFERDAAQRIGAAFVQIHTGKLRRYASLSTLADTVRIPLGTAEAWNALRRLQPDVVFSTGGFVSVPTVVAARMLHIPSLTHEQTAYIGLATKINARFADMVALSFERSAQYIVHPHGRVIVTGNPVRRSVLHGDVARAKAALGLVGDRPLVYVTGGAQGARMLNAVLGDALVKLLGYVELLHQCGPTTLHDDANRLRERATTLPADLRSRYHVVEQIGDELADVYAASTLVVGRAGAGTVNELATLGVPALLIPLPNAKEQYENAQVLVETGQARILEQSACTVDRLTDEILAMVREVREARPDINDESANAAAKRIADELLALAR